MLRVGVFPADQGGCGHYRLIWPWAAVNKQFSEIEVDDDLQDQKVKVAWSNGDWGGGTPTEYNIPQAIMEMPDLDVAVFQRPLHAKDGPFFKLLREKGVFVVVDLDDNFDRIHTSNVAWFAAEPHWMTKEEMQKISRVTGVGVTSSRRTTNEMWYHVPAHRGAHNRGHLREALQHVDLLIVSTPALKHHYSGAARKTVVIDNFVPERYLDAVRTEANLSPVVGWTGSINTHPTDLQEMGASLQILRRTDDLAFTWKIVGTGVGVEDITGVAPDVSTGWVGLHGDYQREYASFDIAVCPLADIAFNRGKSWLKGIEAAALGVVPVMSNLPEYERLHADGIGLIAKKPQHWVKHIRRLLREPECRRELVESGQEAVRAHYTLEGNAWRWAEAITDAIKELR